MKKMEAEASISRLNKEIEAAIAGLGQKYYEANKDKTDGAFAEDIATINEASAKLKLWKQYRLKLDNKMLCESCGAELPGDSLFCNKCGSKVEEIDFSSILPKEPAKPEAAAPVMQARHCTGCGRVLLEGARFCEGCGKEV